MRLLKLIYLPAFFFLFVTASVTAYGLSHPELGLVEANPVVRAYISEYGLVVGLLIAILYNSSVLISSWLFFTLCLMFKRRYKWHNTLTDAIAYSLVATFGLYALIAWLLNTVNDVCVLLFHSDPHLIAATLELWTSLIGSLLLAIFLILFLIHTRGHECMPKIKNMNTQNCSKGHMKIIRIARLSIHSWLAVLSIVFFGFGRFFPAVYGQMAADCYLEPTEENYIGVRYKALLLEDELSETGWVLLFGQNGLTMNGEYQPHFINLMIKARWAFIYEDPLCQAQAWAQTLNNFTVGFGLDDYEDGWSQDNDIAIWTRDPDLFPRIFSNIDSADPEAADGIGTEYQVDEGGTLEGREIEVSLVREEVTMLSQDENYFMDPDLEGEQLCKPCSQADILYRHWVATLRVPSLGVDSSVDFYINASQGDKIRGDSTLSFMWESWKPAIDSDKYKVILYDIEVKTISGEWKNATRFVFDIRTDNEYLPLDDEERLAGGYRKVNYKGQPAMEASFGYGYTDYVADANLNDYDPIETKGVVDLQYPVGSRNCIVRVVVEDCSGSTVPGASVSLDRKYRGITDSQGEIAISNLYSGYHSLEILKSGYTASTIIYVEPEETHEHIVIPEFPPFLILPLFMIVTLLAVIVYRRNTT